MAKIAQASQPATDEAQFISVEVPATVRMNVEASNAEEAREIISALLGQGDWQRSDRVGIPFAIRTE